MKISISLGGSLITKNLNADTIRRYANALRQLKKKGHQLVVVCGGGRPAREYINIARLLRAPFQLQDRLGILATHMNSLLLIAALGKDADPHIHRRASDVKRRLDGHILVGGGHLPGSSTDYRTVLFAIAMEADLIINATDYGGIFDKDPSKYSDAVQYSRLNFNQLENIIKTRFEQVPGDYGLFDLKATKLAQRHCIPLNFVDGTDPKEIIRAVEGGHSGTEIHC